MKHRKQWHRIITAAASVCVSISASVAVAQYQVGQQGRALDASNRMGAAGFNGPVYTQPAVTNGNFNNGLITGNITGGREFRGFVPYSSPDAFRGPTAGSMSDNFIRSSSAAPYGGVPQNNAQVVQSFQGSSQYAPPPPGFVQQSRGSGGYVPAAAVQRRANDFRLDASIDPSSPTTTLPRAGQFLMPGPMDASTQTNTVISASPLYGWRQWNPNTASDQAFLNDTVNGANGSRKIDAATMQKMREELIDPQSPNAMQDLQVNQQKQNARAGMLDTAVSTPFDSPTNQGISSSSVIKSNQALGTTTTGLDNNLRTGAGVRQRLLAPQQQSTQYAELQKRLQQNRMAQANGQPESQQQQLRNQLPKTGSQPQPGGLLTLPGVQPPTGTTPTDLTTPPPLPTLPSMAQRGPVGDAPSSALPDVPPTMTTPVPGGMPPIANMNQRPAPLQMKSLSDGVQAKGLADLLKEAESQMKAGKFNAALEEYDLADQLAPNNPLILLGRANAELGQSYYGRAELHLRQAFTQDQALLMGQVDLRSWLGDERLTLLTKDLRGIADREQKEPRPVFLLSYIFYNMGDPRMASAYLDLAEKRAGKDDLYGLIRKHWQLPAQATPDATK